MNSRKRLTGSFILALFAVSAAFLSMTAATLAWYIYNTSAHTTHVRMAAGAGISLQISNSYDGRWGSSALLSEFTGRLNPVSGNKINGGAGFQKVNGFTDTATPTGNKLLASSFVNVEAADYYKTSLFLRTNSESATVYLADIDYTDDDDENPISTAIRVGFAVHRRGRSTAVEKELIFAINSELKNPNGYNTITGREGRVLNSDTLDGSTVMFSPYTSDNYCLYDSETGIAAATATSVPICSVSGEGDGYGQPVEIEVYIWLEGCDSDCTNEICGKTLQNLALHFAAVG